MQVYAGASSKLHFPPAKKASLISKLVKMSSWLHYFPCSHNNFLNTYAAIWFYPLEEQTQQVTASINSLEGYIHFIYILQISLHTQVLCIYLNPTITSQEGGLLILDIQT